MVTTNSAEIDEVVQDLRSAVNSGSQLSGRFLDICAGVLGPRIKYLDGEMPTYTIKGKVQASHHERLAVVVRTPVRHQDQRLGDLSLKHRYYTFCLTRDKGWKLFHVEISGLLYIDPTEVRKEQFNEQFPLVVIGWEIAHSEKETYRQIPSAEIFEDDGLVNYYEQIGKEAVLQGIVSLLDGKVKQLEERRDTLIGCYSNIRSVLDDFPAM